MVDDEPQSTDFFLGKLSGQVKELIHTIGQIGQKVEFLGQHAIKTSSLPEDLKELKHAVSKLEASENRRTGATHFGAWLISSPIIPWIACAGVVAYHFLSGARQ